MTCKEMKRGVKLGRLGMGLCIARGARGMAYNLENESDYGNVRLPEALPLPFWSGAIVDTMGARGKRQ